MKNATILCAAVLMLAGSLSVSANNELNHKKKNEPQTKLIKNKKMFVNMAGPSSISLLGTGYIYEVKMIRFGTDFRWEIRGEGVIQVRSAVEPIINGKTAISLDGEDFIKRGTFTLSLVGETEDGTTVIASKTVTVN
ncbi:hypothetical protein AQ505_11460 [Pedobacter sp. PACM 27299]|uniref:hypothetical protein n=1 Tax=Pedobacter sp. PACM 27299 TaxID=1727164 RepID=UPI0007066799|nr:hypothetical protein [Pedobacter sp. PACM 27299]ALL06054.1 hypothetical protein AQ505_11460 [Pedobacter sp. PACM 27299]